MGEGSGEAEAAQPARTRWTRCPSSSSPDAVKLLERYKILDEREIHARYEIFLENYNKTINIEGQLMVLMANRYILPAAFEYRRTLARAWRR